MQNANTTNACGPHARLPEILFGRVSIPIEVQLSTGELWHNAAGRPALRLVLHDPEVIAELCLAAGSAELARLFIDGRLTIDGSLDTAIEIADELVSLRRTPAERLTIATQLLPRALHRLASRSLARLADRFTGRSSRGRTRRAVQFHYDRPSGFWEAWLDPSLTYSCAYFREDRDTLEAAQRQKLDLVCRKLALANGKRLFDLGSGWGGLAFHAAQHYGAQVDGVTLSREQHAHATARARALGLEDRCRFHLCDYRDFSGSGFDCASSIGAVEHIQTRDLPDYFRRVCDLLRPGGRFLNHGITRSAVRPLHRAQRRGPEFIQALIFPDSALATIEQTLAAAAESQLEVRDVECLREHYARTLGLWRRNLETARQRVIEASNPPTFRTFQLYLAACERGFTRGNLSIYQTLLVKCADGSSGMPWTRDAWYAQ